MIKVAVIGAGPSGLATLRFLAKAHEFFPIEPLQVRLFEAEKDVGGTFSYRVYEDAELVSSKYLTAFSDFRLPLDAPDFVTPAVYVQYLKDYVSHFGLGKYIECNTKVVHVQRGQNGHGHFVSLSKDGVMVDWHCDAIAVSSGLNVDPFIPAMDGIDKVPVVRHSSQVKDRAIFGEDTNVVVFGAGETAMDMAHLAVTSPTKSVTLCHRDGFFCAPKIIPIPGPGGKVPPRDKTNKPVDTSVASLFDTAYAHPVLQHSQLLWSAYDQWVKKMHTLISGTPEGPDQWVGAMSTDRKYLDALFMVKSDRALPYMSAGKRSESMWNKIRMRILNVPFKDTGGRSIEVVNWPQRIDEAGFMEYDSSNDKLVLPPFPVRPDVVVFATGYHPGFPFLGEDYPRLQQANVRRIYKEGDVSVGFIGFCRPSIGAIPPLAELQAQLWVLRLLQYYFPNKVPQGRSSNAVAKYELDYQLHARGGYDFFSNKNAVDHESYAYQLAIDMGSAPTITHVMKQGMKVFFTWAMGSNFNPKFRMVGPWKDDKKALSIMRGELYGVVKQSGGFVYIVTYTIIPFVIFGCISMSLYAVFGVSDVVQSLWQYGKALTKTGKQKRA